MKSLQARVNSGEIVITETDKSKRFCVLSGEQYKESGSKHTKKDKLIAPEDLYTIQKTVNEHSKWLSEIFGFGSNWNHQERIQLSLIENSEAVAPLYLLSFQRPIAVADLCMTLCDYIPYLAWYHNESRSEQY